MEGSWGVVNGGGYKALRKVTGGWWGKGIEGGGSEGTVSRCLRPRPFAGQCAMTYPGTVRERNVTARLTRFALTLLFQHLEPVNERVKTKHRSSFAFRSHPIPVRQQRARCGPAT